MSEPFRHHADAARALIASGAPLTWKQGGFLGQICFRTALSEKQRTWLVDLLEQHSLPALDEGGMS